MLGGDKCYDKNKTAKKKKKLTVNFLAIYIQMIANTKDFSPTEENLSTWNSNKSKKIF